jgi:hypothetical protein
MYRDNFICIPNAGVVFAIALVFELPNGVVDVPINKVFPNVGAPKGLLAFAAVPDVISEAFTRVEEEKPNPNEVLPVSTPVDPKEGALVPDANKNPVADPLPKGAGAAVDAWTVFEFVSFVCTMASAVYALAEISTPAEILDSSHTCGSDVSSNYSRTVAIVSKSK